jgi:hypothetical protein
VVHLQENGFEVDAKDVTNQELIALKAKHVGSRDLEGCHTALVDGFVVEGHVPADVVKRLLVEKPKDVAGLAVPGMPVGSPGMEGPNPQAYNVIAFGKDGTTRVYERR